MPRDITITFADGTQHVYRGAPDNVTPEAVQARAQQEFGKPVTALDGGRKASATAEESGLLSKATTALRLATPAGQLAALTSKEGRQDLGNFAAGGARGAGSIGATLTLADDQRRGAMDDALTELGADPQSGAFKTGKLGAEVGGTAGAGGAAANALARIPGVARAAPGFIEAVRTGGFSTGGAGMNRLADIATRAAGGAVSGGASVGMVNPEDAGAGAAVGAVLPPAVRGVEAAMDGAAKVIRGSSKRLMQSAIKPTIAQLKSGDADVAVEELLKRGINPTAGGVEKLRGLIDDLEGQVSANIASSSAVIPKQNVLNRLGDTRKAFSQQVSPTSDLTSIQRVADDFTAHPGFPGADLPVQAAQDMKRGTYRVLAKKYGEAGSAETEAQKALARGLKEEISAAVPSVAPLNAEMGRLITTLDVAERRALMELNKNPMGLAALAQSPSSWAMFMADKSALFKSLAARMLNTATPAAKPAGAAALPMQHNALLGLRAAPVLATQD